MKRYPSLLSLVLALMANVLLLRSSGRLISGLAHMS